MASRLAEIYRSEKKIGGGLGSAVGKRLTEKIDPRKMLDQSGLLVSMFPSLKAYNPTKNANTTAGKQASIDKKEEAQTDVLREMLQVSSLVSRNSSINAKNSLVLPAMARDMNLMRQNMAKLVKLQGGVASNKADMFFKRAGERESMYESSLSKLFKKDKAGSVSKIGTSTAGDKLGLDPSQIIASMAAGSMMRSVASMVSSLLMNPIVLGVLGGSLLIYLAKRFAEEDLKKPENKDAPINKVRRGEAKTLGEAGEKNRQKALGKLTTQGTANEIVKRLIEDKLTGAAAESFVKEIARESNLQEVLDICDPKLKEDYLKMVASLQPPAPQQPPPSTPPPPLPATGAGGGRGFVNPELVSPSPSPVPSNVIMSGSGVPLTSGSGEYITSGQGTSPVSTTGTAQGTMGSYVSRGASPSPVSSGGQSAGLNMPDKTIGDYIKDASKRVGVDEGIMLAMANQESSFNPSAKPVDKKTGKLLSSAKGLYQFLNSTWDSMVSKYSKNFPELLKGPLDPLASAVAGALYIKENGQYLASKGIPITGTSIYAAHFLGPGGARDLFSADPSANASEVLPKAAASNKHIFYNKDGTSKSVDGVIQTLYGKVGQKAEQYAAVVNPSNIKQSSSSTVVASPSKPSSGSIIAAASTSVADGQRQSMAQPTGGTAVVGSQPPKQTLASTQRKPGSAYDTDLINTLIGRQSATA